MELMVKWLARAWRMLPVRSVLIILVGVPVALISLAVLVALLEVAHSVTIGLLRGAGRDAGRAIQHFLQGPSRVFVICATVIYLLVALGLLLVQVRRVGWREAFLTVGLCAKNVLFLVNWFLDWGVRALGFLVKLLAGASISEALGHTPAED